MGNNNSNIFTMYSRGYEGQQALYTGCEKTLAPIPVQGLNNNNNHKKSKSETLKYDQCRTLLPNFNNLS